MQFAEAFKKLGYDLRAVRTDWSAANAYGVCLSLWAQEADWQQLVMDTREHAGQLEGWRSKSGNTRRIEHAKLATEKFDGWVDVVKLSGVPGESYGTASPWKPSERRGKRWRITYLDEATGHLRIEAQDWAAGV